MKLAIDQLYREKGKWKERNAEEELDKEKPSGESDKIENRTKKKWNTC